MQWEPTPDRFAELAEYNTVMSPTRERPTPEHGPGMSVIEYLPPPVVFSPEYTARMSALQAEFRVWMRQQAEREGDVIELSGGGYLVIPHGTFDT